MLPPGVIRPAGGIGRIKQPAPLALGLEGGGVDGGLHDGHKIARVDLQHLVHALGGKGDAAAHRHAAAHIAMPGAARGHGNLMRLRKSENLGDRLGGTRQRHGVRPMRGEPFVAGVLGQLGGLERDFGR